jgi:hypothetical protein
MIDMAETHVGAANRDKALTLNTTHPLPVVLLRCMLLHRRAKDVFLREAGSY